MRRTAKARSVGQDARTAKNAGRPNVLRDNLFAATMLVPVVMVAVLASGKIAFRTVRHVPLLQATLPVPAHQRDKLYAEHSESVGPFPAAVPGADDAFALAPSQMTPAGNVTALQTGDQGHADAVVQDAFRLVPNGQTVGIVPSDVAKAHGNPARAGREPKQTRQLRQKPSDDAEDYSASTESTPPIGAAKPAETDESTPERYPPAMVATTRTAQVQARASDEPASLAYPPAPFLPEERTARGTAPSYRPVAFKASDYPYRPVLDTTPSGLPAPALQATAQAPQRRDASSNRLDEPISDTADNRAGFGFGLPSDIGLPARTALDPLTAEVDRDIAASHQPESTDIRAMAHVQVGFDTTFHSGDAGMDRLTEMAVPIEAEFSPGGYGRVKLAATPTSLTAGSIGRDTADLRRFGSGALALARAGAGATAYDQRADGVGLGASYTLGNLGVDVGTTPLGFPITHAVGGVAFAPQITDTLRLRLTGERRALTDSVLSYAGARDARTGMTWGGAVRTRGRADVEFDIADGRGYVGAGGGMVTGAHIPSNAEVEFGVGAAFPVYHTDTRSLSLGLDLAYFGYQRNLRFFTLGQGGYFSPQRYVSALVPVNYKEQVNEDLSYEVGAAIGVQSYHEHAAPYYPRDAALQSQLVALPSSSGARTSYAAQNRTGLAGNGHVAVDYRLTPSLHLGALAGVLRAGNFTEASGMAYARYVFRSTDAQ